MKKITKLFIIKILIFILFFCFEQFCSFETFAMKDMNELLGLDSSLTSSSSAFEIEGYSVSPSDLLLDKSCFKHKIFNKNQNDNYGKVEYYFKNLNYGKHREKHIVSVFILPYRRSSYDRLNLVFYDSEVRSNPILKVSAIYRSDINIKGFYVDNLNLEQHDLKLDVPYYLDLIDNYGDLVCRFKKPIFFNSKFLKESVDFNKKSCIERLCECKIF